MRPEDTVLLIGGEPCVQGDDFRIPELGALEKIRSVVYFPFAREKYQDVSCVNCGELLYGIEYGAFLITGYDLRLAVIPTVSVISGSYLTSTG